MNAYNNEKKSFLIENSLQSKINTYINHIFMNHAWLSLQGQSLKITLIAPLLQIYLDEEEEESIIVPRVQHIAVSDEEYSKPWKKEKKGN